MTRNSAGQCVPNITVPNCGINALNVGGRCVPNDPPKPTITVNPVTPVIPIKNPDLRHPSLPINPQRTPPTRVTPNFPKITLNDPKPKRSNDPPYVIGRGGHGLNVYNPSGPSSGQGSGPSGRTTNKTVPFRTGAKPILHAYPNMMGGSNTPNIR
jgi:hypothetical protein